jgi:hypothetical protein
MSDEEFERNVSHRLVSDRRAFIKKMVVGAAFAAPAIASFNMVGLGAGVAHGHLTSNTTHQSPLCRVKERELQSLLTAYSSVAAVPGVPAIALERLQLEIQSVEAFLAANCGSPF